LDKKNKLDNEKKGGIKFRYLNIWIRH
jgi:hypothetical protein